MKLILLSNKCSGLVCFRKEVIQKLTGKYDVLICTPDDNRVDELKEFGCRFRQIPFSRRGVNPAADLKLYSKYKKLIRDESPDVVLTYTVKPNVYGGRAAGKAKVPYIANITGLGTSIENGGMLSKITLSLYKVGLKSARCVMFQNGSNKAFFESKNIVGSNARLIPGSGVNLEEHFFEEYPSEEGAIRFLFVGRIMRDKGIDELLAAFWKIHGIYPETFLDIVGGFDEDYGDVIREAEEGGFIKFHGSQKDVHSFYKKAHCVVLPSYHEGMANVLLEASSTGRPVIATNVPGCRETFDDGVTGFGCDVKCADSLFVAFEKFLALDRSEHERMGIAARAKMEREFDRNIVIDAYLEELDRIITERR